MQVAMMGYDKCVKILTKGGCDVNKTGQCSLICLHCPRPHVSKHIKLGYTTLMLASRNGHDKCVQLLIEAGANVNQWKSMFSLSGKIDNTNFLFSLCHGHSQVRKGFKL